MRREPVNLFLLNRLAVGFLALGSLLAAEVAQAQYNYVTNNGAITITGYTGSGGDVTLPASINGLPVSQIGYAAFQNCTTLRSLTIPSGVTSIADFAFIICEGLTQVAFPEGVTNIGLGAFAGCTGLTEVVFPSSLETIGFQAFFCCSNLTNAIFANTNTDIGDRAFAGTILTNELIRDIGEYVCVTNNGTITITGFGGWGNVTIPETIHGFEVVAIGDVAFANLETWRGIPSGLTGITIPSSVTSIGNSAFADTALTTIAIPGSITNFGETVFDHCTSLTSVIIPNGIARLGGGMFQDCCNLTNVMIPDSVIAIGYAAFAGCSNLSNLTLSENVTNLGWSTFANCSSLKSITLPNHLALIDENLFYGCSSLTQLVIPSSVAEINCWLSGTFENCFNLHAVYFLGDAPLVDGADGSLNSSLFSGGLGTVYYLPGTSGWGSTFGGWPTAQWHQPAPQILDGSHGLGLRGNQFNFTVAWATNAALVIQACTNLANPVWTALATNSLSNGVLNFSEPRWTNAAQRFFRVQSP